MYNCKNHIFVPIFQTCLYGLSVTLRCAAGKKYAQVSSMKVCTEMKDLLRSLSDTEPGHRPELAEVAKVTIWHYVCCS